MRRIILSPSIEITTARGIAVRRHCYRLQVSMLHFEFGQQPVGLGASATYLLPYTTLVESQYLLR